MKNTIKTAFGLMVPLVWMFFSGCQHPEAKEEGKEARDDAGTPVTVTEVSSSPMSEYIELNAVSSFLQKNYVKANANGYLESADVYPGKFVKKGDLLFKLKTKEAQSLGNSINALDSTFRFSGLTEIRASAGGYLTQLNHQAGDYVQDGEQLAAISNMNSFVFLLDLPYELRPYVLNKKTVDLVLPDNEKLTGTISSALPTVDASSQTQSLVIRVNAPHPIPENLIAKVRIVKSAKAKAVSVPKAAVLTNETQDDFWVMKMIDSTTAVKVPIRKGIETTDQVEIVSPVFNPGDRILVSGNYGLSDTAKVKITTTNNP
jgi:multidrug efflux pump subunit AcrA (membrane-fusion protein)